MQKSGNYQTQLPIITSSQVLNRNEPKKIKDLLSCLRDRKFELQQKLIKAEIDEEEQTRQLPENEKNDSDYLVKERLITEIPCYHYRRNNRQRTFESQTMKSFDVNRQQREELKEREGSIITKRTKKKSILEPVVNARKSESRIRQNSTIIQSSLRKGQNFQQIFRAIPKNPKERTDENMKKLKNYLTQNNMFFRKINPILTTCFIKLNRLIVLEKHYPLYRIDEEKDAFYIILYGKMKIYNNENYYQKLKKICKAGETLGEELVFSEGPKRKVVENAKSITKVYLVQIKLQNYRKMREQMMRYGYKMIFLQMESILKRNHITKNWLRSQAGKFNPRK